jgi:thiol-disulfide isomerase/thioredoxin
MLHIKSYCINKNKKNIVFRQIKKLKKAIFILLLIISNSTNAQTINLEFPFFEGKTYEFKIFQGDKMITLKTDTIHKGGKVQLFIPKEYAGYKGIAQWYLTNSTTGGGLDLIINNHDFSVSCLDSIPSNENIKYTGSNENVFSKTNYTEQQQLFEKHDAMLAAVRAYPKNSKLYKICNTEYQSILKQYNTYSKNLAESPLYAATFRQIVNLTMGIGTIITNDQNAKANNINDFIVNDLDFAALYTSNHWGGIINNWVELQKMVIKEDSKLLENTKKILKRLPSNKIYTDFVINLTKELTKAGKDNIIALLTPEIKNANRLLNYEDILTIYQKDISGKAPNLIIVEHLGNQSDHKHIDTQLETDKLNSKYTLLVFYKSGCGPCEETIVGLKVNYSDLTKKGVKIISISADSDEQIFKNTSFSLPWSDKFCNLDGMNGVNFKNYAVIGTPTMYVLDNLGIIQTKIATITELLAWVKQH